MPEESEEGFVFRDRRRSASTEEAVAAPVETQAETLMETSREAQGEAYDDQDIAEMGEMPEGMNGVDGSLPDVYSVLALFLQELRSLAWLRMGLVANPSTGQIERDLEQARTAINTVSFLAQQLDAVVSPEEKLPLKALVSDLQINFVEQSKRP
ncbi:MAG: DUF1844 domain-containing protein [Armatimonadetes bacterium]|nr:DUF1844 domain-containing protein [Armatimonadota bacterium]